MGRIGIGFAIAGAVIIAAVSSGAPALAHDTPAADLGPGERVVQNFSHPLPDVPGKALTAVEVTYAPGGKSLPHRHAGSAFVYAYVVSGSIRSHIAGEPVRLFKAGQSFYETPGQHHLVSENASSTEPARLLAVFIADTTDRVLTRTDNREQGE